MKQDDSNPNIPDPHASVHPENIGPYRILETLGRGGMGTVYLAEQQQPVNRHVALKVINWGMESENIVARFHSERQALALMNHPYIATVYDGGTTREGMPFFAMEAVEGEPILEFCDSHKLATQARLELFLKVCEGVQHAHQKLVIHRDLKPSNILVKLRDGVPEPKLIDFGIAKSSKAGNSKKDPNLTLDGTPLGTPLYMSPEQVEGKGLDARVDVYALGVLLYELLVGAAPFESKNADYYHMLVKVMEEEPLLPSTRLTSLGSETAKITQNRQTDSKALSKLLKGDLDWIILKAMEKDRERRYESVSQLKDDVLRHFRNEPVNAKPKSTSYRVGKFVQRHKIGVVAAAMVLLALLLGVIGTTFGLLQAINARDEAKISEERALATLTFLEKVLASVDPSLEGRQMRIVDLLDKALAMVDHDLTDQPLVESSVRRTVGWSFLEMGHYREAEAQLQKAYDDQRKVLGDQHLDTLNTYNALGRLYYKVGRFSQAEAVHSRVFEIEKEVLGPSHPTTLWTQYNLAKAIDKQGQLPKAEAIYRDIITRRSSLLGTTHSHTLVTKNSLALLLAFDNRSSEGERLQINTMRLLQETLGENHPQTINAMANLVAIYALGNKPQEGKDLAEKTIELQRRVLGNTHPETLETQTYFAATLVKLGNLDHAETILNRILDVQIDTIGGKNPETLMTSAFLSKTLFLSGKINEALGLSRKTQQIAANIFETPHWVSGLAMSVEALCLHDLNQGTEIEIKHQNALKQLKPFQNHEKELVRNSLRDFYLAKGEKEKANRLSDTSKL